MNNFEEEKVISNLEASFEAQKIAFAPVMFQAAKSLRDLGILKIIADSRKEGIEAKEIALKLKLTLYGVEVLIDAGTAMHLIKSKDKKFYITKVGQFILKDEMTRVNMDFTNDVCYNAMYYLTDSIKTSKPEGLKVFGSWNTVYEALSQLPEQTQKSWFDFDHFYSDSAFCSILSIIFENSPGKILDIGGNTGKMAIQCANYSKDVSITILDLPGQLEKAKQNIENENLVNRIQLCPVNLLDSSGEFPNGFDVIWMSQLLVCFSEEEVVCILKRVYDAMEATASLFILDNFWDRQKVEVGSYCLHATSLYFTCLANGNSRMYSLERLKNCIEMANLEITEVHDDLGMGHSLLECRKTCRA